MGHTIWILAAIINRAMINRLLGGGGRLEVINLLD